MTVSFSRSRQHKALMNTSINCIFVTMLKNAFAILTFCFGVLNVLSAAEPTQGPTNGKAGSVTCTDATISWTNGDGGWRTVIVKKGSAVDALPSDGTTLTAFNTFTAGDEIGTGNFVCFNNITNNFSLKGLESNTRYYVAIVEHDGLSSPDYLTSVGDVDTFSFSTEWLKLDFEFDIDDSCDRTNLVTFTNKSTASFTGISYTWVLKDGNTVNGKDITHTYDEGGNYQVTLVASPSKGCSDFYTNSNAVRIIPRPESKPIEMNGLVEQCLEGNLFRFSDVTTIKNLPKMAYVRTWFFAPDDSSTIPRPIKTFSKAGTYRIGYKSETFYDNQPTGCTDTTSLVIKVIPSPSSGIDINDTIQCFAGNSFVFDNVFPGLVAFTWDLGDGTTANTKSTTHTYGALGTYMIIHEAESGIGCKSKDTVYVHVKPNVDASFTGLPTEVCEDGPSITLTPTNINGVFSSTSGSFSGFDYSPGPAGSHTVKYKIDDSYCPDSTEQVITVNQKPLFSLGRDTTICDFGNITLNVLATGVLTWEDGTSSNPRIINTGGKYWATVNNNGCEWTDTINVDEALTPQAYLPSDTLICRGSILRLFQNWPNSTISWSNGSIDTVIYVTEPGNYSVIVTNACGTATDDVTLRVSNGFCDIFPPTAFTPNGDARNEYFEIIGRDVDPVLLQIFNRWGEMIFDSNSAGDFKWYGDANGEPCMEGNYPYIYRYEQKVGDRVRRTTYKGSVYLMR